MKMALQISLKSHNEWKFLLLGSRGGRVPRFPKIRKSPIQNGGPIAQRKLQYSSSSRKCLKIGGTDFGGFNLERGNIFQKFVKVLHRTVVPTHTENCNTQARVESVQKSRELKYEEKEESILDPFLAIFKVHKKIQ